MLEEIIDYLKQHPDGVSSSELASKFLKFQNTQSSFAHLTISSILSKNSKCYTDTQGNWHIQSTLSSNITLNQLPLLSVFILGHPRNEDRKIYYIALWKIFPQPQFLGGGWTVDSKTLRSINMADQESIIDLPFDSSLNPDMASHTAEQLKSTIPVFHSRFEHNLLKYAVMQSSIDFTDDYFYIQDLAKTAGIEISDSKNLYSYSMALFGKSPESMSAYKKGQLFAECIKEIIEALTEKGIDSREDIDKYFLDINSSLLKGKEFTYDLICSLPSGPGVFGFKDIRGKYLYIGKTDNLKRKLLRFLISPEDNPVKLKLLIQKSHSLVTHQCASELETILYEYRLIKKHSPELNPDNTELQKESHTDIDINNCIILMPHIQKESIMTFWFCKGFKIRIRQFDFNQNLKFISELEDVFFNPKNGSEPTDHSEMNLIRKWIIKNQDHIVIVPINPSGSASELLEAIKFFWNNRTDTV